MTFTGASEQATQIGNPSRSRSLRPIAGSRGGLTLGLSRSIGPTRASIISKPSRILDCFERIPAAERREALVHPAIIMLREDLGELRLDVGQVGQSLRFFICGGGSCLARFSRVGEIFFHRLNPGGAVARSYAKRLLDEFA